MVSQGYDVEAAGGSILVFSNGNISTNVSIYSYGGQGTQTQGNYARGGAAGSGPVFVMAPNADALSIYSVPGFSGGIQSGVGTVVKSKAFGFIGKRWNVWLIKILLLMKKNF